MTVAYRVYANSLSDRTRHVDDTHAFLSGSAVFMYLHERRSSPVEVRMRVEDRLRVSVVAAGSVAAQDAPTSDIDGVEPWALLRGLIDDFEISQDAGTTVLSMSWPLS